MSRQSSRHSPLLSRLFAKFFENAETLRSQCICKLVRQAFVTHARIPAITETLMKHILFLLAALSFGALTAPLARAVTPLNLPVGDWTVNGNGFHGVLHISGVDGVGDIQAGST